MSTIPSGSMPNVIAALNKAIGAESVLEVSTIQGQQRLANDAQKTSTDGLKTAKSLSVSDTVMTWFMVGFIIGFSLSMVPSTVGTLGLVNEESFLGKAVRVTAGGIKHLGTAASGVGSLGAGAAMGAQGVFQKDITEDRTETDTLMSTTSNSFNTTKNSNNVTTTLGIDIGEAIVNNGRAQQEYQIKY